MKSGKYRLELKSVVGLVDLSEKTGPFGMPGRFQLLDTFDQSVRHSGRILLLTTSDLMLIETDGSILTQKRARPPFFLADLTDGPVKEQLDFIEPLRAIIKLEGGSYETAKFRPAGKKSAAFKVLRFSRRQARVSLAIQKVSNPADRAGWSSDGFNGERDFYQPLFDNLQRYRAKPKLKMEPTDFSRSVVTRIIAAHLDIARQNEPGVLRDDDTEFLHDYRVALRKIRSVLSLVNGVYDVRETKAKKKTFSRLMFHTGRVRDLDVCLLNRRGYFDALPTALHPGLSVLFEHFEQERAGALQAMSAHLNTGKYRKQMDRLQACYRSENQPAPGPLADRPVVELAQVLIRRRYRKLCKLARAIEHDTPDEVIHEMRISCKKLRYMMQLFAPLFARKSVKPILMPLKELQDELGLFNDCSVQQQALRNCLHDGAFDASPDERQVALSIGGLITVLDARQRGHRAAAMNKAQDLDDPGIQDGFRRLCSS